MQETLSAHFRGAVFKKERTEMMKKIFMFVMAMALALFATGAMAQTSTTGSIEGLVTDPNGAAVRGATVTVTSPNLIRTQTTATDDSGRYQLLNLPPGAYKVTFEASNVAATEKVYIVSLHGRSFSSGGG